jgi:hypothetical protein
MSLRALALLALLTTACPVFAQDTQYEQSDQFNRNYESYESYVSGENDESYESGESDREAVPPGGVANSAVGQVGQRQARTGAAQNTDPMIRLDSRIHNRVQSRIYNRIDRNYDPQANANSPFAAAEKQQRKAGQQGR